MRPDLGSSFTLERATAYGLRACDGSYGVPPSLQRGRGGSTISFPSADLIGLLQSCLSLGVTPTTTSRNIVIETSVLPIEICFIFSPFLLSDWLHPFVRYSNIHVSRRCVNRRPSDGGTLILAYDRSVARFKAALARILVESSVGSGESSGLTNRGISVQPRTTASQPWRFNSPIISLM